jgi:hypothetical protein
MTPKDFRGKEVFPFMALYCFIYCGLMATTLLNIMIGWKLLIIFVLSAFAYFGFAYFFDKRKEALERWKKRVLKCSKPFNYQMLADYKKKRLKKFLRKNGLTGNKVRFVMDNLCYENKNNNSLSFQIVVILLTMLLTRPEFQLFFKEWSTISFLISLSVLLQSVILILLYVFYLEINKIRNYKVAASQQIKEFLREIYLEDSNPK